MNPWIYQTKVLDSDDISEYEGFVYLITNCLTGRQYVGKKSFWTRKKPKGATRRKTLESDWKSYFGSNKELKADVKTHGAEHFRREVLHLCKYKKTMSYLEAKEQFVRDVLYSGNYYNDNILAKFFTSEARLFN